MCTGPGACSLRCGSLHPQGLRVNSWSGLTTHIHVRSNSPPDPHTGGPPSFHLIPRLSRDVRCSSVPGPQDSVCGASRTPRRGRGHLHPRAPKTPDSRRHLLNVLREGFFFPLPDSAWGLPGSSHVFLMNVPPRYAGRAHLSAVPSSGLAWGHLRVGRLWSGWHSWP